MFRNKLIAFGLLLILFNSAFFATGYSAYDSRLTRGIEYMNTDLRYVFRNLAVIGQFSVVLDQTVTGDVSVSFAEGVSIKDAVSIVAKTCGYYCKWLPDTATVVISNTKDIEINNAKNLKSFLLKSAWAASVAEALQVVIPKERIKPDIRGNGIAVMANDLELQNISEIITRLEQEKQLTSLEVKFIEAPNELLKQIITKYNPSIPKMGICILTDQQWATFLGNTAIKVLTRQNLTMIDGREEKVFIGDSIPGMYENNRDGKIKYHIEYTDIGTALNFKTLVEDNNQLTVQVKEKTNTFRNSAKIGLSGPKADAREVESTISLDSEQSFLLLGSLQYHEFKQMKNFPYTFPILKELYGVGSGQPEHGPATGIIITITPRLTGNFLPVATDESLNETTEVSPTPADYSPIPVLSTPTSILSPSPSKVGVEIPTDEEKPVVDINSFKNSPEKDQLKNNDSVFNTFYSDIRYIIKKGDTFEKIIQKFGVNLQTVVIRNRLGNAGEINLGTSLIIPVSNERIYIVKPKETLWRIAKRYGTTVELLKDLNSITNTNKVQTYQKLVLPGLTRRIMNPKF